MRKVSNLLFKTINSLFLIIIVFIAILPFIYILIISLSPMGEQQNFYLFDAYKVLLTNGKFINSLLISIVLTLLGTIISVIITTFAAYSLSKDGLPFKKLIIVFIYLPLIFNGGLIPFYIVVRSLGLINNLFSMIIPFALNLINLHIMIRFFSSSEIKSIEEASYIGGSNEWSTLFRIVLPCSKHIIATISIFYAVSYWNSWFPAFIFINDTLLYPLQMVIRDLTISSSNAFNTGISNISGDFLLTENIKMASIVISVIPIIPFLFVAQRYLKNYNILTKLK